MTQYLIATSVLEAIVRGSLENDERLRLHTPSASHANPSGRGRRRGRANAGSRFSSMPGWGSTCPRWPPAYGRPLPAALDVHDRAEGRGRRRGLQRRLPGRRLARLAHVDRSQKRAASGRLHPVPAGPPGARRRRTRLQRAGEPRGRRLRRGTRAGAWREHRPEIDETAAEACRGMEPAAARRARASHPAPGGLRACVGNPEYLPQWSSTRRSGPPSASVRTRRARWSTGCSGSSAGRGDDESGGGRGHDATTAASDLTRSGCSLPEDLRTLDAGLPAPGRRRRSAKRSSRRSRENGGHLGASLGVVELDHRAARRTEHARRTPSSGTWDTSPTRTSCLPGGSSRSAPSARTVGCRASRAGARAPTTSTAPGTAAVR